MTARSPNTAEPEHLLLATAKSYHVSSEDLAPPNCEYSLTEGAWILRNIGSLFVETPGVPNASNQESRP